MVPNQTVIRTPKKPDQGRPAGMAVLRGIHLGAARGAVIKHSAALSAQTSWTHTGPRPWCFDSLEDLARLRGGRSQARGT